MPEIDLVMGPQYANRISDLLEDVINGNQVSLSLSLSLSQWQSGRRDGGHIWDECIYEITVLMCPTCGVNMIM